MEKKESFFKSFSREIICGIVVTLVSAVIIGYFTQTRNLTREERNKNIMNMLEKYSSDVNGKTFDAYKYFTPKIERFYQMFDTSPKKINDYVNGMFYKQFKNSSMVFDPSTLTVEEMDNGEYKAMVIMYSTYYKVKEKKQYTNHRTRTELRFDNNFRCNSHDLSESNPSLQRIILKLNKYSDFLLSLNAKILFQKI